MDDMKNEYGEEALTMIHMALDFAKKERPSPVEAFYAAERAKQALSLWMNALATICADIGPGGT